MLKINFFYKILFIFILSNILNSYLTFRYWYINSNLYVDVNSYIEYLRLISDDFKFIGKIPKHYLLRLVPAFPLANVINPFTLILYSFINELFTFISSGMLYFGLSKFLAHKFKIKYCLLFSAICLLLPGIIFTNVTMKPEWPTILVLSLILIALSSNKLGVRVLCFPLSFFLRPSYLFTSIFLFFKIDQLNKKYLFLFITIFPIIFLIGVDIFWHLLSKNCFLNSPFYNPTKIQGLLQEFFYIDSHFKFPLTSLKVLAVYFTEVNPMIYFLKFNPEHINLLSGLFRWVLIFCVFYLIWNLKLNEKDSLREFWLYVTIVVPNVILIGYFQTRYLICSDLILFYFLYIKITYENNN